MDDTVQHVAACHNTFATIRYKKKISLMAGKYDVFWNVKGSMIEIALRVQTAGWIGFGLGESTTGGMGGSDIVTVSVWPNGTSEITDRYAVGNSLPKADTCQDWKLVSASEANGVTTAEMTRALVTSDPQDQPLVANNMRAKVVLAYGADDSFGYHMTVRQTLLPPSDSALRMRPDALPSLVSLTFCRTGSRSSLTSLVISRPTSGLQ